MDPNVVALFHEVADRSPSDREDYYSRYQTPAALRAEVESLLRFDAPLDDPLTTKIAAAAEGALLSADTEPASTRIGSYRIVRLLGRGGMGVVYEAEQDNPRRSVGLKVINPGLASAEIIHRFKQESQALGRLQHPGIAQIYEAGTADTGLGPQPYFAMELVVGEPLLEYAESRGLGIRERLELITRICDGVDHAHQRGIIHRDLKPGNILVDRTGQPKILDFGVARMTDSDVQATRYTDVGQLLGTLAYMSPEQVLANPLDIDTRSDVYALGVTLYQLLAQRLPYESTSNLHDVVRAIQEDDPPPLSTINRAYRGDIETIVSKALEKDKTRRYGSAAALADDIRRYLKDEPIVARPPSTIYHLKKFGRRHKGLVASVAAVFVVLVVGLIASTWEAARARRAERRAADEAATARAINEFLQHDLLAQASAVTQARPGTKPDPDLKVRTALDRAAANVGNKFTAQPLIEASIRDTIGQTYADLGLYPDARGQLERTLELQQRNLGADHPQTLRTMATLGALDIANGNAKRGEPLVVNALEARKRVLGEDHADTLTSMFIVANLYRMQNKNAQAEPILLSLSQRQARLKGDAHTDTLDAQHLLAVVYRLEGKYGQAEPLLKSVLDRRRRIQGDEHPDTLTAMSDLITLYGSMGRYAQAEALAWDLLQINRRVLGADHPSTLVSMYEVATQRFREGKYADAEPLFLEAVQGEVKRLGPESSRTLTMKAALGLLYVEEGRYDEAQVVLDEVLAVRRRVLGPDNAETLLTLGSIARLHQARRQYVEAESVLNDLLERRRRVQGPQHPLTLTAMNDLGMLSVEQGREQQAEPLLAEAVAGRRRVLGDQHPDTLISLVALATAFERQGRHDQAEALGREALTGYEKVRPDNWRRYQAQCLVGEALAGQRKFAEAEPLLLTGYDGLMQRRSTIPAADRPAAERAGEQVVRLYQGWGQADKAALWRARVKAGPS